MDVRIRLLHADDKQRIVLVEAFAADRFLGSALGEASSAEEAEDRALARLRQRIQNLDAPSPQVAAASAPKLTDQGRPPAGGPPPSAAAGTTLGSVPDSAEPIPISPSITTDPEDWSADLTQLDRVLRHLGWGREEEKIYLQRLFGQPSRSRLTSYADLTLLQQALAALGPGSQPDTAPLPLRRSDLVAQCDELLSLLGWPTDRARQELEQHFAVTSRQHLTDQQLLAFNLLLEGEILKPSPSA